MSMDRNLIFRSAWKWATEYELPSNAEITASNHNILEYSDNSGYCMNINFDRGTVNINYKNKTSYNVSLDYLMSQLGSSKYIVHQLRAGAPDKACISTDSSYQLLKHDNTNLVDYTEDELLEIKIKGEYILPADEGDIKHANKLNFGSEYFILLPQTSDEKVIKYDKFVPKDSVIYKSLVDGSPIRYMDFTSITLTEFMDKWTPEELNKFKDGVAIKSTTGSGSRGVWLIDKQRAKFGGSFISQITYAQWNKFVDVCRHENCNVMLQDLIPVRDNLKKINVDFVISAGALLGYMWTIPNQSQLQTNWDNGTILKSQFTDDIMHEITKLLTNNGIYNAIMNFEAFSDMHDEVIIIEFNWRYSNSMFQSQAAGIDLIGRYLRNEPFSMPNGEHEFIRYWQCAFKEDIDGYHNGK